MTERARRVLNAALRLPEAERLTLARQLLAALQGDTVRAADRELARVAEDRSRQLELGTVKPIPWSKVKREARRCRRDA